MTISTCQGVLLAGNEAKANHTHHVALKAAQSHSKHCQKMSVKSYRLYCCLLVFFQVFNLGKADSKVKVGTLQGHSHGVSGDVFIRGDNVIEIENFYYDGNYKIISFSM